MLRAVEDEIAEVRRRLGDLVRVELRLRDGALLERTPGAFVYRFAGERVEAEPGAESAAALEIPEDTSGMLHVGGQLVPGAVLLHDPTARVVVLELQLNAALEPAEGQLSFSSLNLLLGLRARLKELAEERSPPLEAALAGRALPVNSTPGPRAAPLPGLGPAQARAVEAALACGVSFLWGPPGTGKTRTLAHLTAELLEAGETVLLTANTNVAVDRLVGATLDALGSPRRSPLLRLGRAGPTLRGRGVTPEEVLTNSEAFSASSARLQALLRGAGVAVPDRPGLEAVLRLASWSIGAAALLPELGPERVAEVKALGEGILKAAAAVDAPVMAATLCGTYTRPELRDRRFDTVVLDEASMASVTLFAAAAGLARRRVVVAGDFQQLPPIVLADTPEARTYLGQHMFAFAGCDEVEREHPLRSMLREQWRMHPQVGGAVSRVFYGGLLVDAAPLADRDGGSGRGGLLLADTHGRGPVAHRSASRSLRNPVHARLIAEWLAGSGWESVGVIAPYRAQARLLRAALGRTCRARLEDGSLQVSTVHRFQGEERDLIVFDTTAAPGRATTHFLDDLRNPAAANLINVAISRAKHALLIVGDVPWLQAQLGPRTSLCQVLREAMRAREEVDVSDPADLQRLHAFLRRGERVRPPR